MSNDMSDYMKVAGCGDPNANAPPTRDLEWKKLVADRDALAAENSKLRDALRKSAIMQAMLSTTHGSEEGYMYAMCAECNRGWYLDQPENHAPGCFAAPQEPRT